MRYIRKVAVTSPGTRNEHIIAVAYSVPANGQLFYASRQDVAAEIYERRESYRTHNDHTKAEADVITKLSRTGDRYITTVADGRETNNLLELPRF
jgi:hypothetical protein